MTAYPTYKNSFQKNLDITSKWTTENCVAVHPDKTKYMIIETRHKLGRCPDSNILLILNGNSVLQSHSKCLLGVDIDPNLSWSAHIKNMQKNY